MLSPEKLQEIIELANNIFANSEVAKPATTKKKALDKYFDGNENMIKAHLEEEKKINDIISSLKPEQTLAKTQVDEDKIKVCEAYLSEMADEIQVSELDLGKEVACKKTVKDTVPGIASVTLESTAERTLVLTPEEEKAVIKSLLESGNDVLSLLKLDEEAYLKMDGEYCARQKSDHPQHLKGVEVVHDTRLKAIRKLKASEMLASIMADVNGIA